ncbi:MAG: hypothetical protein HYV97_10270 [Bdellovibrio sp.]|nr:hypothetical protein [Bdellovibrio sp.]
MLRRILYVYIVVIVMAPVLGHAISLTSEGMEVLNTTKLTHIDLDGDGKIDLIRAFDSDGFNIKDLILIHSRQPFIMSKWHYSYMPKIFNGETLLYTSDNPELEIGKQLEKHSIIYDGFDRIKSETHQYLEAKKKIEIVFSDLEKTIITSELRQGQWVEVKSEQSLSLDAYKTVGQVEQERQAMRTLVKREYVDCLAHRPSGDGGNLTNCQSLVEMDMIRNAALFARNYALLTCKTGDTIYTPSGFRIDTASCSDPQEIENLQKALREVTEKRFTCLAQINPRFVDDCLTRSLIPERPRIRCGHGMGQLTPQEQQEADITCQNDSGDAKKWCYHGLRESEQPRRYAEQFCRDASTPAKKSECMATAIRFYNSTNGFAWEAKPGDFFLTGLDPMVTRMQRKPLSAPMGFNEKSSLVDVIFHEILHTCGHDGGPGHNHPHYNDDVYGCTALCSGKKGQITREGCQQCLNVTQNPQNATGTNSTFCNRFSKEEVLSPIRKARELHERIMKDCDKEKVVDIHCANVLTEINNIDRFKNICNMATKPNEPVAAFGKSDETLEREQKAYETRLAEWSKGCVAKFESHIAGLIFKANEKAEDADEVLVAITGMGDQDQGGSFKVKRNAAGNLEITDQIEVTLDIGSDLMRDTAVAAFCSELRTLATTNPENAYNSLKTKWETKGNKFRFQSYRNKDGIDVIPPVLARDHSSAATFTEAQTRCQNFGR